MSDFKNHIFHYTGGSELLGIVTKRALFATNTSFLNDRFEGTLPSSVLQMFVDRPEAFQPWMASAPAKFREAFGNSLRHGKLAVTTSLSRHWKSLPQFRMYSPPAGGFAIGFPREYLTRVASVVECDYSEANLHNWCASYVREFFTHLARIDDGKKTALELNNEVVSTTDVVSRRIIAGLTFKKDEFSYEAEVRLYRFGVSKYFRASRDGNLIKPYDVLDLPNEKIPVFIVCGPNRDPNLGQQSIFSAIAAAKAAGTEWDIGFLSAGEYGYRA
jgi:Protein of unknown function (DUF2971)